MSEIVEGSCYCGAVKWQFEMPIKVAVMCHCTMCRKLNGSDYSSHVFVAEDQFKLVAGQDNITEFQATENVMRAFCRTCGSPAYAVNNKRFPGHIVVGRSCIDTDVDIRPRFQVFTQSKGDWVTIHDDVKVMNR